MTLSHEQVIEKISLLLPQLPLDNQQREIVEQSLQSISEDDAVTVLSSLEDALICLDDTIQVAQTLLSPKP